MCGWGRQEPHANKGEATRVENLRRRTKTIHLLRERPSIFRYSVDEVNQSLIDSLTKLEELGGSDNGLQFSLLLVEAQSNLRKGKLNFK